MLPDQSRLFASAALLTLFASSVARAQEPAPAAPAEPAPPPPAEAAPPPPPPEPAPPPQPAEDESLPAEKATRMGLAVSFNLLAVMYLSYKSLQSGSPLPYLRAYDNKSPFDPVAMFPQGEDGAPAAFGNRNWFG